MRREALDKLNRQANEMTGTLCQNLPANGDFGTILAQYGLKKENLIFGTAANALESESSLPRARSSAG